VVGDLSIAYSHGIDRLELNGLASRGDAEELAQVGAVVGLEGGDDVIFAGLPMDFGPKVGKRVAQSLVEDQNAGFVSSGAGLGGVVDEVIGEEFVEQAEISLALHLFGVSADHRFDGFAVW